jgi:hypothetical protein
MPLYNIIPETKDGVQLPISPTPCELAQVGQHIVEWIARYKHQGYYSNCNHEHLYLNEMAFAIVPVEPEEAA